MKKTVLVFISALLLVGLAGCGGKSKPNNVSDEVYNRGVAVIEIVDKYLDDEVSLEDVAKELAIDNVEFVTNEEIAIRDAIVNIWEYVLRNYDTKENILEWRNGLAELLKLKLRKE